MNVKGTFQIDTKRKLIIMYLSGDFNIDDFIFYHNMMSLDPNFDPEYNRILDLRDSNPILEECDIRHYVNLILSNSELKGKRKSVFLTNKPKDVVVGTLFEMLKDNLPISSDIFSTINGIEKWFNDKDIDAEFIDLTISKLKNQPNIFIHNNGNETSNYQSL